MNKERSYRRFLALCITLLLLLLAAGCGIMEGPETQADTQAVSDFGYQITSQADAKPAVSASTFPAKHRRLRLAQRCYRGPGYRGNGNSGGEA